MDRVIKVISNLPEDIEVDNEIKYFIHGREDSERIVITVYGDIGPDIFGVVTSSTTSGLEGKACVIKKTKLQDLLLQRAFGQKWEVSMSRAKD
jgi:hypothetical protein